MKRFKRMLCLCLSILLLVGLCACEKEEEEAENLTNDTITEPTKLSGEDTAPTETEEVIPDVEQEPLILVQADDWHYIYDENKQIIGAEANNLQHKYEYAPQEDGTVLVTVSEKFKDQSDEEWETAYERTYDANGRLTCELRLNPYQRFRTEYFYDENGWLVKEVFAEEGKELSSYLVYTYTYNEDGYLTAKREGAHDDPNGPELRLVSLYEYTYNDNNETIARKWSWQTSQDPDAFEDQTDTFTWETDVEEDCTRKVQKLVDGHGYTESICYYYDENGSLTSVSWTEADGAFHAEEYAFVAHLVPHDVKKQTLEYMSWSEYLRAQDSQ